jgi:hypothetical protein
VVIVAMVVKSEASDEEKRPFQIDFLGFKIYTSSESSTINVESVLEATRDDRTKIRTVVSLSKEAHHHVDHGSGFASRQEQFGSLD